MRPLVARTRTQRCVLLLAAAACSLAAVPAADAAPGVPDPPATVFTEGFENVIPPTASILVSAYTGPAPLSETYTANGAWITDTGCNGIVISQAGVDLTPCGQNAALKAQASALGTFNGTSATTNHAWTSFTNNSPAADLVELETVTPIPLSGPGRFVAFAANVAAATCTAPAPQLEVFLMDGATAIPAFATPYNTCTGFAVSGTATYAAPRAALVSGSAVGVRIVNATAGTTGNDHGLDDLRVLDATPKLDAAFTSPVAPGATSRLTLTITNTSELAEKAGWSFTDTLPAGLIIAPAPNIQSTCTNASVGATPGAAAVSASGALTGQSAACTVGVDIAAAAPGTYVNGPANVTARAGIDPAATSATVTFQPPPLAPAPDAKRGTSVTLKPLQGSVLVKVPGSPRYVDVARLTEVPLGSRVDTRRGLVNLTAEVDATTGQTQNSWFYDGIFVISQTQGRKPILVATLAGGTFAGCAPRTTRTILGAATDPVPFQFAAKGKRSKRKVRRLWGKGQGDFRTEGRRSTATVRGTWWLVEDRCDGTLTRVRQGRVDVRDLRLRKTIKLRAGKRYLYLAKAP